MATSPKRLATGGSADWADNFELEDFLGRRGNALSATARRNAQRLVLGLFFLVVISSTWSVLVPDARAVGVYAAPQCTDEQLSEGPYGFGDQWSYWKVSGHGCLGPHRIQLSPSGEHFDSEYSPFPEPRERYFDLGEYSLQQLLYDGIVPLDSVRVTMTGSNGIEYGLNQGIRFCGETCSPLAMRSSDDQETPEVLEFSVEEGTIPPGATLIEVVAECVDLAGCDSGDLVDTTTWRKPLDITSIEVTHRDDDPPDVYLSIERELSFWNFNGFVNGNYGWTNDGFAFGTYAGDGWGTGVARVRGSFGPQKELIHECEPQDASYVLHCPSADGSVGSPISKEMLAQGANQVHGYASDFVGNESTVSESVMFDSIPPSSPVGIQIKPGRLSWVSNLSADIEWDIVGERLETSTQSGVVGARLSAFPVDAGMGVFWPMTVTGEMIDESRIWFPSNGRWILSIETIDRAGNVSAPTSLSIVVDDRRPGQAEFTTLSPITAADRLSGKLIDWNWTSIGPSGICGSAFDVNGLADMNPGDDADNPTIVGAASGRTLSTGQIDAIGDGVKYVHLRAFSCAGLGSEVTRATIQVDTTRPTVRLEPSDGWLNAGEQARLVAEDVSDKGEQSGVASIEYTVNGVTTTVDAATSSLSTPAGVQQVSFKAIDGVGNETEMESGLVRRDVASPSAWLNRPSLEDPTSVSATARDAESGVASMWLELHPLGGGRPMILGQRFQTSSATTDAVSIERQIPDDESVSGAHVLEVHAVDETGKHTVSRVWRDGSSAELAFPLRPKPALSIQVGSAKAGFSRVHRSGFGERREVRGHATLPGGAAAAGLQILLRGERQGHRQAQLGVVTTKPDGSFALPLRAFSSKRVVASFGGTKTLGPASAAADLQVSSGVTAKPSRTRIRRGKQLIVSGRVSVGDAAVPAGGKPVVLRFKLGDRWNSLTKSVTTFDDGRFSIPFSFRPRRRATRIAFQVVVPVDPGWPFERGVSRQFKVVFER